MSVEVTVVSDETPVPPNELQPSASSSASNETLLESNKPTPAQDKLKANINKEQTIVLGLYAKRADGMLSIADHAELRKREKTLADEKKTLQKTQLNLKRQQTWRDKNKRRLDDLDEETRKLVTGKKACTPGRPLKEDQSGLIAAICRIAISGSAAHERRRNEVIRTVKTLDQLVVALRAEGYELSRSSVHLHLLPRNSRTIEGKRHVNTAPVKLMRAQNSEHKGHIATQFARSSIKCLEEIAGFLGPQEVTFHSQDDKARVPIGLTAANKQAPLLMHMEYQVQLCMVIMF